MRCADLDVEDGLVRHGGVEEVPGSGVGHALGLARRPRRVQDEQQVLAVHRLHTTTTTTMSSDRDQQGTARSGHRHSFPFYVVSWAGGYSPEGPRQIYVYGAVPRV